MEIVVAAAVAVAVTVAAAAAAAAAGGTVAAVTDAVGEKLVVSVVPVVKSAVGSDPGILVAASALVGKCVVGSDQWIFDAAVEV